MQQLPLGAGLTLCFGSRWHNQESVLLFLRSLQRAGVEMFSRMERPKGFANSIVSRACNERKDGASATPVSDLLTTLKPTAPYLRDMIPESWTFTVATSISSAFTNFPLMMGKRLAMPPCENR